MTRTAVVLGGGISGLSSAYYLQKLTKQFSKIILLESSNRLGGWIKSTVHDDGAIFEHGPRTMRPVGNSGINSLLLVEELGLENDVIFVPSTGPHVGKRYIYVNDQIHLLPNGISALFRKSPPFTKPLINSIIQECRAPKSDLQDESIHNFAARRVGTEVADFVANPVCRGIFAGDTNLLSMKACFPVLFEREKKDRSLVLGSLKKKIKEYIEKDRAMAKLFEESELLKTVKKTRMSLWSLRHGLQQMANGIQDKLQSKDNVQIRVESPCKELEFSNGKCLVKTNEDVVEADVVISSIYAKTLSKLLSPQQNDLSDMLSKIPAVTVAVVNIEFDGYVSISPGFGHLLPSFENKAVLGVVYDVCAFEEHDKKDGPSTRFTVMLGGAWFDDIEDTSKSGLEQLALDSIRMHLGVKEDVTRIHVEVCKDCIPQYLVGHSDLLTRIESKIKEENLPLYLVGASYKGPSVNDCIYNAKLAVEEIN